MPSRYFYGFNDASGKICHLKYEDYKHSTNGAFVYTMNEKGELSREHCGLHGTGEADFIADLSRAVAKLESALEKVPQENSKATLAERKSEEAKQQAVVLGVVIGLCAGAGVGALCFFAPPVLAFLATFGITGNLIGVTAAGGGALASAITGPVAGLAAFGIAKKIPTHFPKLNIEKTSLVDEPIKALPPYAGYGNQPLFQAATSSSASASQHPVINNNNNIPN